MTYRRNLLVGWVLLIPTDLTFMRLVFALLLSVVGLTLLLSCSPYKRLEDTILAAGCQLTLIISFIGARRVLVLITTLDGYPLCAITDRRAA